jgi:hypothetical protein
MSQGALRQHLVQVEDALGHRDASGDVPELMQSSQAVRFLGFRSKTTLIKWAEHGLIPATKIDGRWWFKRRQLERWLEGRETAADGQPERREGHHE